MRATIKIEFSEQSKTVVADAKVELEGECNSDEDLRSLRLKAQEESKEAFDWAYQASQKYKFDKQR